MRNIVVALIVLLLGSAAAGSSSSYSLNAYVRVGHSPADVAELTVPLGAVASIDLANDLRLEFSTPAPDAEEQQTVTTLLRRSSGDTIVLHTTRQGGVVENPRSNAYLVCRDEVTFMSPAPGTLPDCDD
jgi:hypothetical protein